MSNYINALVDKFNTLRNSTNVIVVQKAKFTYIQVDEEDGRIRILARVDTDGNIYSTNGKKPRANINQSEFNHGLDIIDKNGVIVNANKLKNALNSSNLSQKLLERSSLWID